MAASLKFTQKVWQHFLQTKGHDANSFPGLKILSAKPGIVTASLKVEPYQANRLKTLHGGVISSLVDTMGSLALSTKGFWLTGVSTDIHVTMVRGAAVGEDVRLKSEIVGLGKTLAYTRVEMSSEKTGKLLAFGSHTKFIQLALKAPENVRISDDGETLLEEHTSPL